MQSSDHHLSEATLSSPCTSPTSPSAILTPTGSIAKGKELMQTFDILLKSLNPPQKIAVETLQGPVLVLAGAGSGKTRVLTHRMAKLVAEGYAAPENILAVTFTNKAASEMESRIHQLLLELKITLVEPLWVTTFHSFCSRLLRKHITLLDYQPHFNIYDSQDQLQLIKRVLIKLNIDDEIFPAKNFQNRINSAKMLALSPIDAAKQSRNLFDEQTISVYAEYEIQMKSANALDFGDLLLKSYELFQMYPDLLSAYQSKFKYVMVDEYQDTNHIQYLLIKQLSHKHRNLCVVGDEDQSIYSWRGADITNILNFEIDYPEATVVKLEENYRSTQNIVSAANHLIKNNSERKDKTLFTNNTVGDPIFIHELMSEYDEARFTVKTLLSYINSGSYVWSDCAIFYRTNSQTRVLEEQLRLNSVPYRIIGGMKFYERMEVKDLLCYMRMALNTRDDLALKRIINTPTRGIGKTTVTRLEEIAQFRGLTLWDSIIHSIDNREFASGVTQKLRRFFDLIEQIKTASQTLPLIQFYQKILEETEYLDRLKQDNSEESKSRIENLEALSNAIEEFEKERGQDATLVNFLEEMSLVSDTDEIKEGANSVTLMTLHISKGLEFPLVFIVGLEEGLFPSAKSSLDIDPSSVEEERRLAYVGMTRAREVLYLTYTKMRRIWGQERSNAPSRFLDELPSQLVKWKREVVRRPQFLQSTSESSEFLNNSNPNLFWEETQAFSDEEVSKTQVYQKGRKVFHPNFGVGQIYELEGSGDNLKVSILFPDHTIKKFVAKYAKLKLL